MKKNTSVTVAVYITADTIMRIDERATELGLSRSAVVRMLLDYAVEKHPILGNKEATK